MNWRLKELSQISCLSIRITFPWAIVVSLCHFFLCVCICLIDERLEMENSWVLCFFLYIYWFNFELHHRLYRNRLRFHLKAQEAVKGQNTTFLVKHWEKKQTLTWNEKNWSPYVYATDKVRTIFPPMTIYVMDVHMQVGKKGYTSTKAKRTKCFVYKDAYRNKIINWILLQIE